MVAKPHADALAAQLAEAERQRDWHRDDAAMVRRERDAEVKRLVAKLAEVEVENEGCRRKMAHVNVMGVMVPKRVADALAEAEARAARLRDAYLAAETRIMADAEAQVVGSLASQVAGLHAQRDCRRTLQPGDLDDQEAQA